MILLRAMGYEPLLASHSARSVGVKGLEAVIHLEHEREAHGDLGRRHGQDENEHDLAVNLPPARAGDDEGQAHGVQHHLDAHEHEDDVPASEHSYESEREQDRGEHEAVLHGDVCDHDSTSKKTIATTKTLK